MRKITFILGLLFVLLQYDLWVGEGSLSSSYRLREQADAQRQENTKLTARNQVLAAEVKDLKQGLEAIEERARDEMGMVGKDETFYQIVDTQRK